jgi:hypothetical protein
MMKLGIVPEALTINWTEDIPDESFNSATQYLALLTSLNKAIEIADRLREYEYVRYQPSGTILRAAGLCALRDTDILVQNKIREIGSKSSIPYPLLVQSRRGDKVHLVDGYEAVSAAYHLAPERSVPCIIVPWDYE